MESVNESIMTLNLFVWRVAATSKAIFHCVFSHSQDVKDYLLKIFKTCLIMETYIEFWMKHRIMHAFVQDIKKLNTKENFYEKYLYFNTPLF